MRHAWLILLTCVGCRQILGLHDLKVDAGGPGDAADAPLSDAGVCTAASAECASATVLRTCAGPGSTAIDTPCSWGCTAANGAHCAQLVPAGGGVMPGDVAPDPMLVATHLSGTIDADSGAINGTTERGGGFGIQQSIDYELRGSIAMFRFGSLTIDGTLVIVGTRPVALVADGDIAIAGVVDLTAGCPGAGPGGYPGGPTGPGAGPGGGQDGSGLQDNSSGGGGGTYGGTGGQGGSSASQAGALPGQPNGDPAIPMLAGGSGGGAGGYNQGGGAGGGGGGALQLASNGTISITTGGINTGGCGGAANSAGAGGGGGAGGAILIEAPTILLATGGAIAANGGGGGAGRNGTIGTNGTLDNVPAPGGMQGDTRGGAGGAGGAGSTIDGLAGASNNHNGGGGGGGAGRIKLSTLSGTAMIAGTASPPAVQGPAQTQ